MLNTSNVKKGDIIIECSTGRELQVQGLWGDASSIVDFSAIYLTTNLVTPNKHKVYADRGFKFSDEGSVWEKRYS